METAQKVHPKESLAPEERLEAMLVYEGLEHEIGALALMKANEVVQTHPDQLKLKTITKRLDAIDATLDGADDLTILAHEYGVQSGNGASKLDLFDRKFDKLTRDASQSELMDLYNTVAIAHGEDAALLKHIAERIDGNSAKVGDTPRVTEETHTRPGKPERNEAARELHLPKTFAEARRIQGNSIEDYLKDIPKFDDATAIFMEPIVKKLGTTRERAPEGKAFFTVENIKQYEQDLVSFANKLRKENPYEKQRHVTDQQLLWLQFDPKSFIEARVKHQPRGAIQSRIYLNPRFEDMIPIYREIFTEAEKQGLMFRSKVFDPTLRRPSKKSVDDIAKLWENYGSVRIDPMVFYGYKGSQDKLLTIVSAVYEKYQDSFKGRRIGAAPVQVAPGFAVGAEPTGLSGQESLTGHREIILTKILDMCKQRPEWKSLGDSAQKKLFCTIFRDNARKGMKHNIDPSNIAFDIEAGAASSMAPKSPERQGRKTIKERYGLPGGFTTELGSVYRYDAQGSARRHKFDHTEQGGQRMGIAVFYPDKVAYRDVITRIATEQAHLPKEKQKSGYVIEDDPKAPRGYRRVYSLVQVKDPQKLNFALIQNNGKVLGRFPVSITPQKGLYVFEMGRDAQGKTVRHPGHKVDKVLERDEDAIRAWGKLARQAKRTK